MKEGDEEDFSFGIDLKEKRTRKRYFHDFCERPKSINETTFPSLELSTSLTSPQCFLIKWDLRQKNGKQRMNLEGNKY